MWPGAGLESLRLGAMAVMPMVRMRVATCCRPTAKPRASSSPRILLMPKNGSSVWISSIAAIRARSRSALARGR